jgi:hypothetical protein
MRSEGFWAANLESGDAMQIHASGNGPAGKLSETIAYESTQKSAPTGEANSSDGTAAAQTAYVPTADLAQLLASVRALPDLREDVVREVGDRVATGELFTPQAAHDAALAAYDDLGR